MHRLSSIKCHCSSGHDNTMTALTDCNRIHIWFNLVQSLSIVCKHSVNSIYCLFEAHSNTPVVLYTCAESITCYCYHDDAWIIILTQELEGVASNLILYSKGSGYSLILCYASKITILDDVTFGITDGTFCINLVLELTKTIHLSKSLLKNDVIHYLSYDETVNVLIICTTVSLSLSIINWSEENCISTCQLVAQYRPPKEKIINSVRLSDDIIIILTETGKIQFVTLDCMILIEEWDNLMYNNVYTLVYADSYYVLVTSTDRSEPVSSDLLLISFPTSETVISLNLEAAQIKFATCCHHSNIFQYMFINDRDNLSPLLCLNFSELRNMPPAASDDLERTRLNLSEMLDTQSASQIDWMSEILSAIKESDFKSVCYLWWKFYDVIKNSLSNDIYKLFLAAIATSINIDELLLWINCSLLTFDQMDTPKQPYLIVLIDWVESYIQNCEKSQPNNWIEKSLQLINFLYENISSLEFWDVNDRISTIKSQIEDIEIVLSTLQLRISFSRLSEYSLASFLHQLLRHAHNAEQICKLLSSKAIAVINRHGDSLDNVLYKYILSLKDKLTNSKDLGELLELKAITVANFITSHELRTESALLLLHHSSLPVSDQVFNLAEETQNLTGISICDHILFTKLRNVLIKYDIMIDIIVVNKCSVIQIMNNILKYKWNNDFKELLADFYFLVEYYQISKQHLFHLIARHYVMSNQNITEFIDCLQSVDEVNTTRNAFCSITSCLIAQNMYYIDLLSSIPLKICNRSHLDANNVLELTQLHYESINTDLITTIAISQKLSPYTDNTETPGTILSSDMKYKAYNVILAQLAKEKFYIPETSSPSKLCEFNHSPIDFLSNIYFLPLIHKLEIYETLVRMATDSNMYRLAINLITCYIMSNSLLNTPHFRGTLNIIDDAITKLQSAISEELEPLLIVSLLKSLLLDILLDSSLCYLDDISKMLSKLRLVEDIMIQSHYEIKPRKSAERLKECKKIFRQNIHQQKGFVLDKKLTDNCIHITTTNLEINDDVIEYTRLLSKQYLVQTSLNLYLYSIFRTYHKFKPDILTQLLIDLFNSVTQQSPIDTNYALAILATLETTHAQRELSICSKKSSTSPTWIISMSWLGLLYGVLFDSPKFTVYGFNSLLLSQCINYVRSVTKIRIETPSHFWNKGLIVSKLMSGDFKPVMVHQITQLLGENNIDSTMVAWIKESLIHNVVNEANLNQALNLIENAYNNFHHCYVTCVYTNHHTLRYITHTLLRLHTKDIDYSRIILACQLSDLLYQNKAPLFFAGSSNSKMSLDAKKAPTATDSNDSLILSATNNSIDDSHSNYTLEDLIDCPAPVIANYLSFEHLNLFIELSSMLPLKSDRTISSTIFKEVNTIITLGQNIRLSKITPYIEQLESLEVKVAVSKWLATKLPRIESRVEATTYAMEATEKWKKIAKNDSEKCKANDWYEKLSHYHKVLKVDIILAELELTEKINGSESSSNPRNLIKQLIGTYKPKTIHQCKKLQSTISALCKLFELSVDFVITDCINSIISRNTSHADLNNSFSFYIEAEIINEDSTGNSIDLETNVHLQLIVLLSSQSNDINTHLNYLLRTVVSVTKSHTYNNRKASLGIAIILLSFHSESVPKMEQKILDILNLVYSIFSNNTDQPCQLDTYSLRLKSLKFLLQLLEIVEELEILGYSMTALAFLESSRISIIRGLMRNFSDNFRAFELAAKIGLIAPQELDVAVWEEILRKLENYCCFEFLLSIVPKLDILLSHNFMKPLKLNILLNFNLSQKTKLFTNFLQLAHSLIAEEDSEMHSELSNSIQRAAEGLDGEAKYSQARVLRYMLSYKTI